MYEETKKNVPPVQRPPITKDNAAYFLFSFFFLCLPKNLHQSQRIMGFSKYVT